MIESTSGFYTVVTVKVVSNGNEDFSVFLKTNHANSLTASIVVFPLNDEVITFTSTDPGYSGQTLEHVCEGGKVCSSVDNASGKFNISTTGNLAVGNGTISLPSISFGSDQNTGLYRSASDNLGFAIGGTARAFMSNTQFNMAGKLVGTELDINGVADISGTATIAGATIRSSGINASNSHLQLSNGFPWIDLVAPDGAYLKAGITARGGASSTQGQFHLHVTRDSSYRKLSTAGNYDTYLVTETANASSYGNLIFGTDLTEAMRISSSNQSVGIGETTPLGKLHVKTADSGAGADGTADELVVEGSGDSGLSILSGASNYGTILFSDSGDSAAGRLRYEHNNNKLNFGTNGSWDRMVIDSVGRVGINDAAPAYKLDITESSDNQAGVQVTDGTSWLRMIPTLGGGGFNSLSTAGDLGLIFSVNNNSSSASGGLTIAPWSSATGAQGMRIKEDGNIGIGTASPASRLHISSGVAAADDVTLLTLENGNSTGDISTPNTFIDFTFTDANANTTPQVRIGGHAGDGGDANSMEKEGKGYLTFHTSNTTGTSAAAPPERVRITHDGKLGINTTSPGAPLDIRTTADGSHLRLTRNAVGSWDIGVRNTATLPGVGSGALEIIPNQGNSYLAVGLAGGGTTLLHVKNTGTDVTGNVKATGSMITGSNYYFGATDSSLLAKDGANIRYMADGIHKFETYSGSWTQRAQIDDGGLDVTGAITATADVTAYASDERLKTNIIVIDSAIQKVKQLRGVTFDWKDDVKEKGFEPTASNETGVIAQEVQKVIPDAVVPAPFDENYLTVKHEKLIPLLIEAIKEQQEQIDELKQQVQDLGNQK